MAQGHVGKQGGELNGDDADVMGDTANHASRDDASSCKDRSSRRRAAGRLGALGVALALSAGLTGCGLAAAPCRIASAGLKIVPVVGHVAAAPTDACADVIDP